MWNYVWRGVVHYHRINAVVLLAVAISTTVIAGSLIVGDSVRYSLRRMTEQRLGRITDVLHSPRFVRQQLAMELSASWTPAGTTTPARSSVTASPLFAPAILVTGTVEHKATSGQVRKAGSVTLLAIDESGWKLLDHRDIAAPQGREIVLGHRTAQEIGAQAGDDVSVWVEVPASMPRDSLLGERDDVVVELVLTVSTVLSETDGASRFDLNPGQQLPYTAFLPLQSLQERLGLEELAASRRNPTARPAKVNCLLSGMADADSVSPGSPESPHRLATALTAGEYGAALTMAEQLTRQLRQHLTLDDVGLRIRHIADRDYLSVESDRMILEDPLTVAVEKAAHESGLLTAPTLVYLANELSAAGRTDDSKQYSMYSIVAGMPFDSAAPLGPFRLSDGQQVPALSDSEILLSAWLAEDLEVGVGDQIKAKWHDVSSHGELPEIERLFTVRGIFGSEDALTIDQNLTPHVPGITDVESFSDWDQPFDMDMGRITSRDDSYWTEHRATPKAFVSLATAEKLWNSRYGRYTSLRASLPADHKALSGEQWEDLKKKLAENIVRNLDPMELGLSFRPVRAEGLQAAVGANDFTGLFLGFSFFLILSAIILASLMFRLGLQQRICQLGLLNAVGWPEKLIRQLFVREGLLVCTAGAIVGCVFGVYFARLMIYGLTTWWIGAVGTKFLVADIHFNRLATAAGISMGLAFLVIRLALRSFKNIGIREQLAGNADASEGLAAGDRSRWSALVRWTGRASLVMAIGIPVVVMQGWIPSGEAFAGLTWQVVSFFIAGMACLHSGLYLLSSALRQRSGRETVQALSTTLRQLALANAARSPMRSLLTTALIASATFVIVAVGAGRRNPLSETPEITSGNGGFSLVAESAQPILYSLNTPDGRIKLGIDNAQPPLPVGTQAYSFSTKPGSDASCVNLYQTRIPTLLGASDEFLQRGGFRFADTPGENPWTLLQQELPPAKVSDSRPEIPVIPVIGDMNTLMFSLKKDIHSQILFPDAVNPSFALQVVGKLDGSVFQGVLVMTEANLQRIDVSVAGARYFLIETATSADAVAAATVLETSLNALGFDTEPVSQRLAGFLAVQNTYLSTFQMLGSLGLLIGTFGLAAVMTRNILERRREIALMRAVGFTTRRIFRLLFWENGILLLWGILLGTGSALLAMLPHLRSTGADVPWLPLVLTLVSVAAFGSLASLIAIRTVATISVRECLAAE